MPKQAWRYDHLTWPEMKAAIGRAPQPVVAIPIGAPVGNLLASPPRCNRTLFGAPSAADWTLPQIGAGRSFMTSGTGRGAGKT